MPYAEKKKNPGKSIVLRFFLIGMAGVFLVLLCLWGVWPYFYFFTIPESERYQVKEVNFPGGKKGNQLVRDGILIGMNLTEPKELRRQATGYYHQDGPVGQVLEQFNWLRGVASSYRSDNRLPASLLAISAVDTIGLSPLPMNMLVQAWSEPPIGVLGLEVGTIASYARPFQHIHYYKMSAYLKDLVLPQADKPHWGHARQIRRGSHGTAHQGSDGPVFLQAYRHGHSVHSHLQPIVHSGPGGQ